MMNGKMNVFGIYNIPYFLNSAQWIFDIAISVALLYFFSVLVGIQYSVVLCGRAWTFLQNKIPFLRRFKSTKWSGPSSSQKMRYGLEENITLPSTGDEALKRLLACRGKDPYRYAVKALAGE